jgi:hypothetical protein
VQIIPNSLFQGIYYNTCETLKDRISGRVLGRNSRPYLYSWRLWTLEVTVLRAGSEALASPFPLERDRYLEEPNLLPTCLDSKLDILPQPDL